MHFVIYKDSAGEWRWRLVASNGKTIGDSGEGYKARSDAEHGIHLIQRGAASAEVREG